MKLLGLLLGFVLLIATVTSKDQSKEYDRGSIYSSNSNYPSSSSLYGNRYPYSSTNNYNNRYPYNQGYSNGRYGNRYNGYQGSYGLSNDRDD